MKSILDKRLKKLLAIIDSRLMWFIAGLITLFLCFVLSFFPDFVEKYYTNGVYVGIRFLFDHTLGYLPFSLFYFLLMFLLGLLFYRVFLWFRLVLVLKSVPFKLKFKLTFISILSLASKIFVMFFLLWGFNYFRVPIEDKLDLNVHELRDGEVLIEFNRIRKDASDLRKKINFKQHKIPSIEDIPEDLNSIIHENLESVLVDLGYVPIGSPPIRFIKPFGFLYSFGITGYYNPFLGEANMDKGFSSLYIPFLYAHELVHAYGFADEGTANFLAYLTCEKSANLFVKYSGRIIYLQYLSHQIKDINIKWNPYIYEDLIMNGFFSYDPKYGRMINLIIAFKQKYTIYG